MQVSSPCIKYCRRGCRDKNSTIKCVRRTYVTQTVLNFGTYKNNKFSIWNKIWKIYYFKVSQNLGTIRYFSFAICYTASCGDCAGPITAFSPTLQTHPWLSMNIQGLLRTKKRQLWGNKLYWLRSMDWFQPKNNMLLILMDKQFVSN